MSRNENIDNKYRAGGFQSIQACKQIYYKAFVKQLVNWNHLYQRKVINIIRFSLTMSDFNQGPAESIYWKLFQRRKPFRTTFSLKGNVVVQKINDHGTCGYQFYLFEPRSGKDFVRMLCLVNPRNKKVLSGLEEGPWCKESFYIIGKGMPFQVYDQLYHISAGPKNSTEEFYRISAQNYSCS